MLAFYAKSEEVVNLIILDTECSEYFYKNFIFYTVKWNAYSCTPFRYLLDFLFLATGWLE